MAVHSAVRRARIRNTQAEGRDLRAAQGNPLQLLGHSGGPGQLQHARRDAQPRRSGLPAGPMRLRVRLDRAAQDQEGAELLPGVALSAPLETDRRGVHPVTARGEYAQAEPPSVQHGGGGGGVPGAAGGTRGMLSSAVQDGGQFQASTVLARGRQLDLPELGNGTVPTSDLPEGSHLAAGVVAHVGTWGFVRHAAADVEHLPGVRPQSPLQSAGADRVQEQYKLRHGAETSRGQTDLPRP
uniref:(northern house mosquito) hypothetical protein n=1 Tax=Culex pipiens TaxID=7175 RepID=A0A8D8P1K7_CULPI